MVKWQRNLYVITAAELIAIAGFSVVMPFLPFYVQELGITDPDQIKLWSGWLASAQAVTMAVMAPIWGILADRYGRKIMVERAMFGGAVIFIAMGLATSVQQLLVLRALQGVVTGTVPAATALVAASTPRDSSGHSLGILQTGIYLGGSLGPVMGGFVSDWLGYRAAFWLTSICLFLAGVAVHKLVEEQVNQSEQLQARQDNHAWDGVAKILKSGGLRLVFLVRLLERLGSRLVGPMLPLYIQELVTNTTALATIAGAISGAGAMAAAAGSFVLGKQSDRIGHRKMLLFSILGLAVFYVPQAWVSDPLQLGVLQVVTGFLMAGVLASVAALLANLVPEGRHGAVYGVNTTIVAAANALAPTAGAGLAIWLGLGPIFYVAAGLFAVGGAMTWLFMPRPATAPATAKKLRVLH